MQYGHRGTLRLAAQGGHPGSLLMRAAPPLHIDLARLRMGSATPCSIGRRSFLNTVRLCRPSRVVRRWPCPRLPRGWCLRRSHPQGREASEPAGSAINENRIDHQPQDRQDARHHRAAVGTKSRRRGDRINSEYPLLAQSRHELLHCICPLSGVKQTCRFAPHMSA